MEIIETLNSKIDKLIHDYDKLRLENLALQQELDSMKNENSCYLCINFYLQI